MTKEEFKMKMEELVKNFGSYWDVGKEIYPSQFPDEMNAAEWFEQFTIYSEQKL